MLLLGEDRSAGKTLRSVSGEAEKSTSKLGTLAKGLGLLGGAFAAVGIGSFVKDSINLEAQFGQTMNTLQAAAQVPAPQMKQLNDLALKLGASTQFSAQGAADAMLEMAKAGIKTADIMKGGVAGTLTLAAAGGTDLATAATIASNAMNTFNLRGKDMPKIAAAMAGGANASTASVESLGLALQQVGPGATNAGLSLQETVGTLAAFDNAGIKGADSGTSLKTMLSRLVPQTDKASGAMKSLGLNFVNANGSFKSIAEIAGQLHDKMGKLSQAERTRAMSAIFGSDATRAATVLMKDGAKGIEGYIKATKDQNAAQDMAKARMKGTAGAIENLKGSIETAQIMIGQVLAPVVQTLANGLAANLIPALTHIGHGFMDIVHAAQPLVAFLGTVLPPLFARLHSDGPSALDAVRDKVDTLLGAWKNFYAAFIPIVRDVVTMIRQNWGPISAWARQTFGQVRQIIGQAFALIVQIIRTATSVLKFIWEHFGDDYLRLAKRVWQAIGGVITGALRIISGILKVALSVMKGDWSGAWDGVKQILSGAWKVITSIVSLGWAGVKKAFSLGIRGIWAAMKALPGLILKAVVGFDTLLFQAGVAIIQGLINGIGSMAGAVEDKIGSIASGAVNKVKGVLGIHSPSRVFSEIGRNIMEGLGIGLDKGKVAVSKALDALTTYIGTKGSQISDLLSKRGSIVSSFQGFTSSVFSQSPEAGVPTAASMIASQAQQRHRAILLKGDVAKLLKMGLSRDLIQQMAASGESGFAQIHALAGGSAAQVAQLNTLNAQTQAALTGAGMSAGNALYGDAIASAQKDKQTALEIRNQLEQWRREQDKNTIVEIHLEGRTLQMSLLQLKRNNGGKALGLT
jgi:TP901 family phage tail tape measure protein